MKSFDRSDDPAASTFSRIRALQTHRSYRDSTQTFWIEGVRQFMQAADADFQFDTIVHSRLLLKCAAARKRVQQLAERDARRIAVTPEQFRAVSITERASGIGAIVKQRWTPLYRADPRRGLCWIVLETVRSAGNLGTVLRTAEAAGVAGVIFLDHACDPYNLPVVRASMGGIFQLQLVRATHVHLRRWASASGVTLVALTPHGDDLWSCDPCPSAPPTALLIGEERKGLSARALAMCDRRVRLPMFGRADSLNLGVAAGVMMYELLRRRRIATRSTTSGR